MDKYALYHEAVQCPEDDLKFLVDTFREVRGREPLRMGEDFSGGFANSCEWVKKSPEHHAVAVDLDSEALGYGREHYFSKLTDDQKKRLRIIQGNVLDTNLPKVDVIAALNFSYYIFKTREELRAYFRNAYARLEQDGIFVGDAFGGSDSLVPNEEYTEYDKFTYFWDQTKYDALSNRAVFHIHFKLKGQPRVENVFTYDWRMWSLPELREILLEAGFRDVLIYWEGSDGDGEGNGIFTRVEEGDTCSGWLAYVVGVK